MHRVTNLPSRVPQQVAKYSNKLEFGGELFINTSSGYGEANRYKVSDTDYSFSDKTSLVELVYNFIAANVPWSRQSDIKNIKMTIEVEDK